MRTQVPPSDPPIIPLRVNDLLFVNEYFRNGQNATQAYLRVHPTAKYGTAESNSRRVLGKAPVQAEVARRVRYEGGITKEFVQSSLLWAYHLAESKQDYVAGASIAMDCAKLAGLITEKREVKTLTDTEGTAIRDLVRRSLLPPRRFSDGEGPTPEAAPPAAATVPGTSDGN